MNHPESIADRKAGHSDRRRALDLLTGTAGSKGQELPMSLAWYRSSEHRLGGEVTL